MADPITAIIAIRKEQDGQRPRVSVTSDSLDEIIWHDDNPTNITNEQILAKQAELQVEFNALEWKRNRQSEYPDAIECVHALLDGGDTLTDLQAKRTAIKDKYPKE